MTSKLVVNTIEADTGISSVSFASSISLSSTSKFFFGDAGIDIGSDTNINRPATGVLGFNINSSEKVRINSDGRLLIGSSSVVNLGGSSSNSQLQIEGTTGNTSSLSLIRNQNNNGGSSIRFGKTRGSSTGAVTTVADGDTLGSLTFSGADGTDVQNATAQIKVLVNGTVGGNQIPTDIIFETSATSGNARAERVRITSEGALLLSTAGTRRNTKGSSQYQALLIEGTTNNTSRMSMIRSSNDDNGPEIQIIKTRGTSVGSVTKPNQNDYLGAFVFLAGDDSDLFTRGAEIGVQATGTPANDRCPSDIIFSTTPTSGASTPQERLRINSSGYVTKPSTPAFFATHTGASNTQTGYLTYNGSGAGYYNNGNHFSTSTGAFTAPVDGIYHFHFHAFIQQNASSGNFQVLLERFNVGGGGQTSITRQYGNNHTSNIYGPSISMHYTGPLTEGQYVKVNTSKPFHGSNGYFFGGYLIG